MPKSRPVRTVIHNRAGQEVLNTMYGPMRFFDGLRGGRGGGKVYSPGDYVAVQGITQSELDACLAGISEMNKHNTAVHIASVRSLPGTLGNTSNRNDNSCH